MPACLPPSLLLTCLCPQTRRLAMLTLLVVFKDLIPAYRIRPGNEAETEGGDKVRARCGGSSSSRGQQQGGEAAGGNSRGEAWGSSRGHCLDVCERGA